MATVLIAVPALTSAVNATRKIARDLRARGHVVHYIGHPGCDRVFGKEGWVRVFPSLEETAGASLQTSHPTLTTALRNARMVAKRHHKLIQSLQGGEFEGFDRVIQSM